MTSHAAEASPRAANSSTLAESQASLMSCHGSGKIFLKAFFQNPMQWGSQAMDIALWQRGLFVLLSHALGVYRSDLLSQCYLRPEQYTWEFFQAFQLCVRSHFGGATFEATLLCWFYNWNPRLQRTYKTAQVQPACTFTTC